MAEEHKDGFAETVDTAASAAHMVKGAIKAGKAISSAAKGAAAGGPYGAVAGAVWAGRKHIGKIIAVIVILLLLPVLFILMLPGLIFGGLLNAFSPSDTEQPILNSETAIVESANDITFTINSILGEALDDVMVRIEADFASSGADQMEVKNPYSSGLVYNANLIISQYCAARDEDFERISLDDLAAVLRENKEHLYSYTSTRENREVTIEDPETGEDTITIEVWMVYTIRYNGESYLADSVFSLTDEQKELAADYASNLSLFLGDGLLQNLVEWTGNSIPSLGDVTFSDGVTPVVYYNQLDERYASQPYGTDNIGGYGCGPTAMAIVVSSLTDDMVDPIKMAHWSYENGYWCKSSGSYHALIPAAAEEWGLPVSGCTTSEPQRILDALAEGKLVVAIMSEGHFTSSGHFIVLRGVKDGQIMVADPASYKRSEQLWDLSIILNEASRRAAAGGPFWIIG
ncbi:C39 family peptidase [Allofournierella massiliensis]|uniref:Peptidase C39-like protein n=2 Tax=Clostridia TaxID=186801 RepID=A0A4R1QTY4_9FIRM|nr:C39 family peptidase [Fournierella massiliensis]TCL54364.1 peptidase C39-like protein [Fournierella massiliensis]